MYILFVGFLSLFAVTVNHPLSGICKYYVTEFEKLKHNKVGQWKWKAETENQWKGCQFCKLIEIDIGLYNYIVYLEIQIQIKMFECGLERLAELPARGGGIYSIYCHILT